MSELLQLCGQCESHRVYDEERGESACSNCGRVMSEKEEMIQLKKNYDPEIGKPESAVNHYGPSGAAWSGSFVGKDFTFGGQYGISKRGFYKRLGRLNTLSKGKGGRTDYRSWTKVFPVLEAAGAKLGMTPALREQVAELFIGCRKKKLIKGRSNIAFAIACCFLVLRQNGSSRPLSEFVEMNKSFGAEWMSISKTLKVITTNMEVSHAPMRLDSAVESLGTKLGIDLRVKAKAREIAAIMREDPISTGKNPYAMAAAIIYCAGQDTNTPVYQQSIANTANLSVVTIRHRIIDVRSTCRG